MTIEELQKDMIVSMKNKDKFKQEVLSSLLSTAKNMAIEKGCKDNINEDIVTAAILKEIKTVTEMIDSCPSDRADLLHEYIERMEIIKNYAPKMMEKSEIENYVLQLTKDKGITLLPKNKGLIMKEVMPFFKGKADGKLVNQVVSEIIVHT